MKATAKQLDGGEEVQEAAMLANEVLRPVSAVTGNEKDYHAITMERRRRGPHSGVI